MSTTYWPFVWPSPEPVTLTLVAGKSRLVLPVRTGRGADARLPPLPPHELPEPANVTALAPGHVVEEFLRSRADGSLMSRYDNDSGLLRYDAIGLDMQTHLSGALHHRAGRSPDRPRRVLLGRHVGER